MVPLPRMSELADASRASPRSWCTSTGRACSTPASPAAPRAYGGLRRLLAKASKGLGARPGLPIQGLKDFLERARLVRKRLGGMMRQSGLLRWPACAEHNVERLAEDHALARSIAELLRASGRFECSGAETQTNIVMARVRGTERDAAAWSAALRAEGARAAAEPGQPALRHPSRRQGLEDLRTLQRALERIGNRAH